MEIIGNPARGITGGGGLSPPGSSFVSPGQTIPSAGSLLPGQLVKGEVLGGSGGQPSLQIGGELFSLEGNVPVVPGQELFLEVMGFADGRLNLKLVNPERGLMAAPMTVDDLMAALSAQKLPVTEELVALARLMVEHGVPVTREGIGGLRQLFGGRPPAGEDVTLRAALLLMAADLPADSAAVDRLASYLSARPDLGEVLDKLAALLRQYAGEKGAEGPAALLAGLLGGLVADPARDSREEAAARVGRWLSLASAGEELNVQVMGHLAALARQMERRNDPLGREVLDQMERLTERLNGSRVLNARSEEQRVWYSEAPLKLDPHVVSGEIRLARRDPWEGHRDPEDDGSGGASVEFAVEAPMGFLRIHVEFARSPMGAGEVRVEVRGEEPLLPLLEGREERLRARLEALGFRVSRLVVAPADDEGARPTPVRLRISRENFERLERMSVKV